MMVCLDSAQENMVPELALEAEYVLEETWNGWARPVATAEAMRSVLDRWRANDPNGEWGYATEAAGVLICTREDPDEPDVFPLVARTSGGDALYDVTGLRWCLLDQG